MKLSRKAPPTTLCTGQMSEFIHTFADSTQWLIRRLVAFPTSRHLDDNAGRWAASNIVMIE